MPIDEVSPAEHDQAIGCASKRTRHDSHNERTSAVSAHQRKASPDLPPPVRLIVVDRG
jgi:hypothetical protein